MRFQNFDFKKATNCHHKIENDKCKSFSKYFNFSDEIWRVQLKSIDFIKSKTNLENLKLVLFPENLENFVSKNKGNINFEQVVENFPMYKTLEDEVGTNPFILCANKHEEFQENSVGIGIYSSTKTKGKRTKIELKYLNIITSDKHLYNVINTFLEIQYDG